MTPAKTFPPCSSTTFGLTASVAALARANSLGGDALAVDFGHRGERLLRGIGVVGPMHVNAHFGRSVADPVRHATWRQRIEDQHGFTMGQIMVDDRLLLRHVGRNAQACAAAHVDDSRERPFALRLEKRVGDRLHLGIVFGDRDRNHVRITATHRRRLRRGNDGMTTIAAASPPTAAVVTRR